MSPQPLLSMEMPTLVIREPTKPKKASPAGSTPPSQELPEPRNTHGLRLHICLHYSPQKQQINHIQSFWRHLEAKCFSSSPICSMCSQSKWPKGDNHSLSKCSRNLSADSSDRLLGSGKGRLMESGHVLVSKPPNELSKTLIWIAIEEQKQKFPGYR